MVDRNYEKVPKPIFFTTFKEALKKWNNVKPRGSSDVYWASFDRFYQIERNNKTYIIFEEYIDGKWIADIEDQIRESDEADEFNRLLEEETLKQWSGEE
jgi:hypothetical protein